MTSPELTSEFIRSAIIDKCATEIALTAHLILSKSNEAANKTGATGCERRLSC